MSTIKEELQECVCGDWYPADECYELYGGGYVHEDDTDDYVELAGECGDNLYCHQDEVIMCECTGEWYPEDCFTDYEIEFDHYDEVYRFTDNMLWGYYERGSEGWFSERADYSYSNNNDVYFMTEYVAERMGYIYSDNREDWIHEDDWDEDEDGDGGAEWDNTWNGTNEKKLHKTFGMPYTFGVEIETCDGYMDFNADLNLKAVHDGSIDGKEYVTGCLKGNSGVNQLQAICKSISDSGCTVDSTCGIHVHIGGANFNRRFSILSIMLGSMLENEIFSMLPKSRSKSSYCLKIPNKFYKLRTVNKRLYPRTHKRMLKLLSEYVYAEDSNFDSINNKKGHHPYGRYCSSRYKWLNLNNCSYEKTGPDTIEFRCHSGSKDFEKIYNWILICMCFVRYVENNSRQIIESYNAWINGHRPHEVSGGVTLRDIVSEGLGKDGMFLLEYIDKRKDKFLKQD